jgi:SAM-dependent methyltransferase
VRRFSAEYLADTRAGFWRDRGALAALDLADRERVLDVGCGTGSLAAALQEESGGTVIGLDADAALLAAVTKAARVQGDALRLPFGDGAFDLVACQALLVNLTDPSEAVREMARASSDLIAAIEPDNAAVTVESTVETEGPLAAEARRAYLEGLDTDGALGTAVTDLFAAAGIKPIETARHDLVREITPPYSPDDVESAKRKVTASRLREQELELRQGGLSATAFDQLVDDWQAMGRAVVEQMDDAAYHRSEMVPFYVTVGRV